MVFRCPYAFGSINIAYYCHTAQVIVIALIWKQEEEKDEEAIITDERMYKTSH